MAAIRRDCAFAQIMCLSGNSSVEETSRYIPPSSLERQALAAARPRRITTILWRQGRSAADGIGLEDVLSPGETRRIVEAPRRYGDVPAVNRRPEQLRSASRTEAPAGHRRRPEPLELSAAALEVVGRAGRIGADARGGPPAHGAVTGRHRPEWTADREPDSSAQAASARGCALRARLGQLHHTIRSTLDTGQIGPHL